MPSASPQTYTGADNQTYYQGGGGPVGAKPASSPALVTPTPATNTPTVLSDTNIRDNIIPNIQKDAASMLDYNKNPLYLRPGETPDAYNARVKQYQQPDPNAKDNPPTDTNSPTNDYESIYKSVLGETPQNDTRYDSDLSLINSMQKTSDARTSNQLASIQGQFQQKRNDLNAQEAVAKQSGSALLARTGANRTGGGSQVLSTISRGFIRDLSTVDLEEQQVTNDALAAQADNNYKLLGDKLGVLKDKRTEKLGLVNKLYDNVVAEKKQTQSDIQQVVNSAAANGAPPKILHSISASIDANSAVEAAGLYLQQGTGQLGDYIQYKKDTVQKGLTPLDYGAWKTQDDATQDKRAANKAYSNAYASAKGAAAADAEINGNAATSDNPAAQTAVKTILGSGKFTKEQKKDLVNSINSGEDPLTVIKNQAKNIMGQTEATKVTAYEGANNAMKDLQTTLKAYYDAGGKTSYLSGNLEQAVNKLGEVNDPALVGLATQVAVSLQSYRNAISGTAYSNQEGQDINAIFPGINKSRGLNEAIMNARIQASNSIIDGIYKSAVGDKTYEALKQAANASIDPEQQVKDYVSQNPDKGIEIANMYRIPGTTDADIIEYLKSMNVKQ